MKRIAPKVIAFILTIAMLISIAPTPILADTETRTNVLIGKIPITNSQFGGITNFKAATDGQKDTPSVDSTNLEIKAGIESGDPNNNNGYDSWQPVYLQYDFEKKVPVSEVVIYRNTYTTAVSTFKKVKIELSKDENFTESEVIFEENDVEETLAEKGKPQTIKLGSPKEARYIRIWGQGHYIQNHVGTWKGYSNAMRFQEIEVWTGTGQTFPNEPEPIPTLHNIAQGKLPYVYGLEPTDIANISDGNWENFAVHNGKGEQWLQFEYRNSYPISQIDFKLEEGTYESVRISISNNPTRNGHEKNKRVVLQESNFVQGTEKKTVTLPSPVRGTNIRFQIKKSSNEPTKYSEIEIWSSSPLNGEERPDYQEPQSKYNTLVWSDDFDTLDEDKWSVIEGMANHGAIYNREALSIVTDGDNKYLAIQSKNYDTTEALKAAVGFDDYDGKALPSHVTWSSGRVESKNKFSFQYGRMATRAKVNDSQGIWPAIWMLCQDETGHDEIDVLEYLGQDAHGAWTTNHWGIWGKNKTQYGVEKINYEAWSQDFHVYEVEWSPEQIIWYIDGVEVHRDSRGKELDSMHTRPMFPILETQVGDGWVGHVDYTKQQTKQDSQFLIDWIKVYQEEDQPIVRFDDLEQLTGGQNNAYRISAKTASEGLQVLTNGTEGYQNKNNFFYGGQPRYEANRVAMTDSASGEQFLIYEVEGVKDVHLTTYYQTISDKKTYISQNGAGYSGHSIREALQGGDLNFHIFTSKDGKKYSELSNVKLVNNFIEVHPAFARITYDAYNLPRNTRFVKVVFPETKGKKYRMDNGQTVDVKPTDVQLAKVTFLQAKKAENQVDPNARFNVYPTLRSYETTAGSYTPTVGSKMVIVANEKANKNARLREVVELINREFVMAKIPSEEAMAIVYGDASQAVAGDVVIELADVVDGVTVAEGFRVEVGETVKVKAMDTQGILYALRSVMQYLQLQNEMPYGVIVDYPETVERALHLDMGRKYFTPDWIKNLIRELSFMRINAIQLHFSEHEGFRLECETYPNVMSNEYITKAEMRDIIAVAKLYGVEIIPSFDNPGHLRQALRNYPELRLVDKNGLRDSGALDINKPEARQFIKNIFKEYAELFVDSKYFHIGGDEFINFNNFDNYPSLKEFGQSRVPQGVTATGLDGYMAYINEIAAYVKELGFTPRIWHDGVYRLNISHHINLEDYIQVCYWTRWDGNMVDTQGLINKGHDLVNVNDKMYYVLARNAYLEKPKTDYIYNQWHSGVFADGRTYTMPYDRVKGSCYAIWCDVPLKETQEQIRKGIYYSLRAMAQKSWNGKTGGFAYNKFISLLDSLKAIQDFEKALPNGKNTGLADGLIEVRFIAKSTKGQILGTAEAIIGKKGESYKYEAPTFKGFEQVDENVSLSGKFTENKTITLTYRRITDKKRLEEVLKNKVEADGYIAATYTPYQEAYAKGQQLLTDVDADDVAINAAIERILEAKGNLVKTQWQELYDKLNNPKPKDEYTEVSYRQYEALIIELKAKIKGVDSNPSTMTADLQRLAQAEAKLVEIGDLVNIGIFVPDENYWQTHSFDKMLDGNRQTFAWTEYNQEAGHIFRFEFSSPVVMSKITLVYPNDVGKDYMDNAKLELEVDGEWKEVGTINGTQIVQEFAVENLKATQARIRLTQSKSYWLKIAEVEFEYTKYKEPKPEPQPEPQPKTPEVLLPYIPSPAPTTDTVAIEDEEIALASPESKTEFDKLAKVIVKKEDQNLLKQWLNKDIKTTELAVRLSDVAKQELATLAKENFVDEQATKWYHKELGLAFMTNLIQGYEDKTFRFDRMITGKEFTTILVRVMQAPVESGDDWFAPFQKVARAEGLLNDVNFDLGKQVSRQEVALLLYNFLSIKEGKKLLPKEAITFVDKEAIGKEYQTAVQYLQEAKIVTGYEDNTYQPLKPLTRAEAVVLITRILTRK